MTMANRPVHVFATWKAKAGQLDAVLAALPGLVAASRAEPGCLFFRVHRVDAEPDTLVLFEGYRDAVALAAHRDTAHFQTTVLGRIVPLLASRTVLLTTPLDDVTR